MARIGCCQLDPVLGDLPGNEARISAAISDAVSAGADVVVLPELATSGYMFADAAEARVAALAEDSPQFARWCALLGDSIAVLGFCELGTDGRLYNSAAVLQSGGVTSVYRKTHLWDWEKLIFTSGEQLPPVLETRHGALAVMVCYDLEFAELTRQVAVAGAEMILAPVNWPQFPRPAGEHPGEVITAMSTARLNRLAVAACDRAGVERGQAWTGGTVIVDPDGWIAAEAGPGVGTAVADIDLARTHDKKLTEHVDLLADRRLDLYG